MTIKKIAQIGVAAAAATLLVLPLVGCGATNAALTFLNGGLCKPGPTVFLVPDVSGSTTALRQPGGLYTTAAEAAITGTAKACGSLYAGTVEGNGLNTTWTIDGKKFRQTIGGNDELGAAAREEKAKRDVFPKISTLLTSKETPGTDLLGVMNRVSDAAAGLPPGQRYQLTLILLTDGVLNLPGGYSLYSTPIGTPAERQAFIAQLKGSGEIPSLTGFDVYLPGLGVGVTDRDLAKAVIELWQELIPLTGGRLRSVDGSLHLAWTEQPRRAEP
jgi:hypothetical protein